MTPVCVRHTKAPTLPSSAGSLIFCCFYSSRFGQGLYFDHSWIILDDKMIDLAISMTLLGGAPASGDIIFGKDIKTGLPPILDYGVPGRGIEAQAKFVMELLFIQYMDSFPNEKDGL